MNERTIDILKAIIDIYVRTAEPVSSKTIVSNYDLGVSSATVRNEMAELEHFGYISQPHTSAGRIPSVQGYRFYVDDFFNELKESENLEQMLNNIKIVSELDKVMEKISEVLSVHTNYTAVSIISHEKKNKIVTLHLFSVSPKEYVIVMVLESRKVEHKVISVEGDFDYNTEAITNYLNSKICYKTADEIKNIDFSELELFDEKNRVFTKKIIKEVINYLNDNENYECYVKGQENLLTFPEFRDSYEVKEVFDAFNKKYILCKVFSEIPGDRSINISIGSENTISELAKMSLAVRSIDLGDYGSVKLGIAGPVRMNYKKVILSFSDLEKMINDILKNI